MVNAYLIKLGKSGVPGGVVRPRSPAEWQGGFSCVTRGNTVSVNPKAAPFPQSGDKAYIWVHESDNGGGLSAMGEFRSVTRDHATLRFFVDALHIQKPFVGLREKVPAGSIFQALDGYRHDRVWHLTPQDIGDIENAISEKIALLQNYAESATKAPVSRPEDVFNVRSALQDQGFRIVNDHRNKVDELYSDELGCVAYVLKERNNNKVPQPHTLVFHPNLHKPLMNALNHRDISVYGQLLHHSNLHRFLKDPPQTYCGTQVSVTSMNGMQLLVRALQDVFIGPVDERSLNAPETESSGHDEETETERQAITKARIGQGQFRADLIDYWQGCAVTRLANKSLLRASHIKPWRNCNNDERLDPYNGLLLSPSLDLAFDQYLISFDAKGQIMISKTLTDEDKISIGFENGMELQKVGRRREKYLKNHRNIFVKHELS